MTLSISLMNSLEFSDPMVYHERPRSERVDVREGGDAGNLIVGDVWMLMKKMALMVGPVLLITAAIASGAGEETPSIKDVMKLNKGGPKSPLAQVKTKLNVESPDWAALEKLSKEFTDLTGALGKNDPPKGDAESWKKLTDEYHKDAESLLTAAKGKDKDGALAAQKKLAASCKSCHSAHKK